MEIWEDNQACIQMGHNLRGSNTAKHYELRLRFLNEQIWENNIQFSKIDTSDQLSDGFTKALNVTMFRAFRQQLLFNPLHPPSSPWTIILIYYYWIIIIIELIIIIIIT